MNQVHQVQLAIELRGRQCAPSITAPTPEPMRPEAPHDPAIELMEEPSDVSALVMLAPATQDGIDLLDQLRSRHRRAAARQSSNLVLEVPDRFLPRVGVQRSRLLATFDLAVRKPHPPTAALDLVSRPVELHHRPLAEPGREPLGSSGSHQANVPVIPIRQWTKRCA